MVPRSAVLRMAALVAVMTSPSTTDTGRAAGTVTEIFCSVFTMVRVTGTSCSWETAEAVAPRERARVRARIRARNLCFNSLPPSYRFQR